MSFPAPVSFRDLGALVFSDNSLKLNHQLILRAVSPHKRRAVLTTRGAWRIAPLCNAPYPSLTLTLSVFLAFSMALRNPLNRPMRTRMSGGVAGESGRPLPLCRSSRADWRSGCETKKSEVVSRVGNIANAGIAQKFSRSGLQNPTAQGPWRGRSISSSVQLCLPRTIRLKRSAVWVGEFHGGQVKDDWTGFCDYGSPSKAIDGSVPLAISS